MSEPIKRRSVGFFAWMDTLDQLYAVAIDLRTAYLQVMGSPRKGSHADRLLRRANRVIKRIQHIQTEIGK